MKIKAVLLITVFFLAKTALAQVKPEINIQFSKLLATYNFVKQLSDFYPENTYKQLFRASQFNHQHYIDLIQQMDTLNIHESYNFQSYPIGHKRPVMTTSLIENNLINAVSVRDFKEETFGIIPNTELIRFSNIIMEFQEVYDRLIYLPNKEKIEKKGYILRSTLISHILEYSQNKQ